MSIPTKSARTVITCRPVRKPHKPLGPMELAPAEGWTVDTRPNATLPVDRPTASDVELRTLAAALVVAHNRWYATFPTIDANPSDAAWDRAEDGLKRAADALAESMQSRGLGTIDVGPLRFIDCSERVLGQWYNPCNDHTGVPVRVLIVPADRTATL